MQTIRLLVQLTIACLLLPSAWPESAAPKSSRKICDAKGWDHPYYSWVGRRTLIAFYSGKEIHSTRSAGLIEIQTGKSSVPTGFRLAWSQLTREYFKSVVWASPSPDGKWLAFDSQFGVGNGPTDGWRVVGLHSQRVVQGDPYSYIADPVWLPDSRHFIGLGARAILMVNASTGRLARSVSYTGPLAFLEQAGYRTWIGLGRDQNAIVMRMDAVDSKELRVISCAVSGEAKVPESWTAAIPKKGIVADVHVSPEGSHLLWVISHDVQERKTALWVTNLRGQNPLLIKRLRTPAPKVGWEPDPWAIAAKWMLDSKSISYLDSGSLYAVPLR